MKNFWARFFIFKVEIKAYVRYISVWYETDYAKTKLSVHIKLGSKHDWNLNLAPHEDIVVIVSK